MTHRRTLSLLAGLLGSTIALHSWAQTPGEGPPPLAPDTPPPPDQPSALPAPPPSEPAPAPAPAPAGPTQTFPLKNGTTVEGHVVDQQPGRYVVIETADGWRVTIPWEQIGPPPQKRAAPPPAPKPETPADNVSADRRGPLPKGFRIGGRLGLAFPYGLAESDVTLSDKVASLFPAQLELGAQIGPIFYIGAYGAYARGSAGSTLDDTCSTSDCSVYGARIGLEMEFRLATQGPRSPWLGYSVGWSAEEIDISDSNGTKQTAYGGVDLARIAGGLDFRLGRSFLIGPYAGFGASMYLYRVEAVDGTGDNSSIDSPKIHGFVELGGRVLFFP